MKSNYFIDTSLLKSLSIGIKEAIVLDFFYYYNNRNCKSYQISITKIAEHLNIARGHLYKILGKLVKRELIVKSCKEYMVTQNYISVRRKSFKEAHSNSQTSSDIIPNYVNKYSKTKQKNIANFTDTEMYSNESKVYPKESVSILYRDTNIQNSSILNARVDIKTNAKSKIKNIFDLICLFRGEGEKSNSLKSFVIPQKFIADIIQTCDKEIKRANGINFSNLKKILSHDEYELFMNYVKKLAHTGVFIVKENKKLMIDTIKEILKQGGNLKALIEKSLREQEIWICDNRLGVKALNNLWNMLESQFKAKEAKEQQKIIEISHKYKESIQEFIAYRNSKGRYFNSFALNKFLLELAKFEYLKIDIVSAINQSIERGYNWVFKPTNRNRFFNRKAKKVA